MRRIAASLAAALSLPVIVLTSGCGSGGAEPDAPTDGGRGAVPISQINLALDFQPNAVHAGIYMAIAGGYTDREGVDLIVREPGSSSDAPKLLEAGRVELAIMDVNDLGIAREQGADLVGVGAIVQRPLAAVIASNRTAVRTPADLEGGNVGVTGLPSDDAVLDSVLAAGGVDPSSVERTTIGFDSVPLLAAGRVDAATAFWNAEGVALRQQGVATREFRVDRFGAPRYPELVLVTTAERLEEEPESVAAVVGSLQDGYTRVIDDPEAGLDALLAGVPGLEEESQRAQLDALIGAGAFSPPLRLERRAVEEWAVWALRESVLTEPLDVDRAFALDR